MEPQKVHGRRGKPVYLILLALFVLYSLIMVKLLFIRGSSYRWEEYNYNLIPLHTIKSLIYHRDAYNTDNWVKNLFGNVVMFVPLGLFIPILSRRLRRPSRCLLFIVFILLLVEGLQLVTKVGSFDIDDILLNSLGAVIGLAFLRVTAPGLIR